MSIVEVSERLGELANTINQKNLELRHIKKSYDAKLEQINKYIDFFRNEIDKSIDEESSETEVLEISDDEFLNELTKSQNCKKCGHEVYDFNSNSDFILIPKKKLKYIFKDYGRDESSSKVLEMSTMNQGKNKHENETGNQTVNNFVRKSTESKFQNYNSNSLPKSLSKKTCSYCKKPGHSRAKCFVRLSKES